MSDIRKATLISPILGATILTITAVIYLLISNFSFDNNQLNNVFLGILKLIPIFFVIFAFISYFISLIVGFFLYKEMIKNLRTEVFFINMSFLLGFIISLLLSAIDYQNFHSIVKSIFIVIGISLMAISNANYFLVLSKFIIIKKGKNEKAKGSRF